MAIIQLKLPDWLDRIFVWPVMVYRRRKYGYSFRRISIGEGKWTIVDAEDFYRLNNFHWYAGGSGDIYYAARIVRTKARRIRTVYLHREVMKARKGRIVDHKNGDSLDNRRANLRLATSAQNLRNRGKTKRKTSSRFIGVYFHKQRQRWVSHVEHNGKVIWLGRFTNEVEAAKVRDKAAKKHHGEFARLNFPD